MKKLVLVRYGEVALKGPYTRSRMERLLLRAAIARLERSGIPYHLAEVRNARIIIYTDRNEEAARELTKVFGVVSTSPAIEVENDLETIARVAIEIATAYVGKVRTFAIRARRDKRYPLTSKDVEKLVGQKVKEATGFSVDLENPELEIGIEIWIDRAFIYTETLRGPGGLPYGSEGKVLTLLSGGMDSALATWLALKRGCIAIPVFMDPGRFWSEEARKRVLNVAREIREWIPEPLKLVVVDYEKVMERILEEVEPRLRCVVCKSCMLSIASRIAAQFDAKALVTGDSLGQVASQTLDNIYAISSFARMPVLRPLVFADKEEIASKLREIGLYSVTARDVGKCKLVPRAPETRSTIEEVARYRKLVEEAPNIVSFEVITID